MDRVKVGNVEVVGISDGASPMPGNRVYPQASEDALRRHAAHLDADGALVLNFGCFLLRADGTTVLVDTGNGPEAQGQLMAGLDGAGVAPGDVEIVVFTHLHGDHTGWNIDRDSGAPRFPAARYLVPQGDWDHYRAQDPQPASFTRDIAPLEALGCLELIEPGHAVTASLQAVGTPGHTPGHLSVAVNSAGERGCILGDVVLSPIDVEEPDWQNVFDWDHDLARRTRESWLRRLEDEQALVGAGHLAHPGLGRFVTLGGRRTWRAL